MRRLVGSIGVAVAVLTAALGPAQERKTEVRKEAQPQPATKEAKVIRAFPAIRIAPMVKAANVDVKQLTAQFTQQFQPIMTAELQLVRTACQPSDDQYRMVRRASVKVLKETAASFAEWQGDMMQGKPRRAWSINYQKAIQDGVAAAVRAHTTPEQAERHRAEVAARAEDHKRTAIRNMIANLDRDLILSPDQRDRLRESLAKHWEDSWCPSLDSYIYDNQFTGNVPEQFVLPILSPAQQETWRGNRNLPRTFFGSVIGTIQMEAEPLDEDESEPDEAPRTGPDRPEK